MKKLKLNLEDVVVTSMETATTPGGTGTVYGNSGLCSASCSCFPYVCPPEFTRFDC